MQPGTQIPLYNNNTKMTTRVTDLVLNKVSALAVFDLGIRHLYYYIIILYTGKLPATFKTFVSELIIINVTYY